MLCLLLNLSLPQANAGENSQSAQHTVLINTILVIGDSISAGFGIDKQQGWVALLEKNYNNKPFRTLLSIAG